MSDDLSRALRAWRDRLEPVAAPSPSSRRAPGLRREEVAALAGISVNYLVRLEQGRATAPSPSVVAALARALRLDAVEAEHLHRLAGQAVPTARVAGREVTASVQRILDRFGDAPLIVVDAAWTIVAANPLAGAFLGASAVGDNAALRQFIGPPWVEREAADEGRFERDLVGDLHRQLALHPDDAAVREVVAELLASSERFAALWEERPAGAVGSSRKTFQHPDVGRLTVDCDVLAVVGSDLRVVVWTAAPGTPDADAMAVLGAAARRGAQLQPLG